MRLIIAALFGAAIIAIAAQKALAISFCDEPSQPACIAYKIGDWNDFQFSQCKSEVETYLKRLVDWQNCVADEADQAAKKAVNKFNCYAKGQQFC